MPSDDYALHASGGGGALKLKGAKVDKKKKKKRVKTDLDKNLSTGDSDAGASSKELVKKEKREGSEEEGDEDDRPTAQKTESERQHEEAKKKRVSFHSLLCLHAFFFLFLLHFPESFVKMLVYDADYAVAQNGGKVWLSPRTPQDTQGARGRTQHLPLQAQRTSRHAQDWTWLMYTSRSCLIGRSFGWSFAVIDLIHFHSHTFE